MRILIEHARDLDKLEKVFAKSKYDYNVKLESEHGKTYAVITRLHKKSEMRRYY